MVNLIRKKFLSELKGALEEAKFAAEIEHKGLEGNIREILVERFLRPVIPPEIRIGSGKLIDCSGRLSNQIDVVLYAPEIVPAAMFDVKLGLFPAECCLYSIEVKTKLTRANLKTSISSAKTTRKLRLLNTELWTDGKPRATYTPIPINVIFAFDSDLSGSPDNELTRYFELDGGANTQPAITVICIVGRGYWFRGDGCWQMFPPSTDLQEVLAFLAGISNTIPQILALKGRPRFGNYLTDETQRTKIVAPQKQKIGRRLNSKRNKIA